VLKLFSEILKGYFHPDDLIGRIGGDEFMVLVLGDMPDGYTERRCRSVLHELKTTQIDGASGITRSIGIVEDTQRMTFKELYEKSDKALYKAKEGGKARYCIAGVE
jgi:diguanylate cyclase (GGDEF)-like protein